MCLADVCQEGGNSCWRLLVPLASYLKADINDVMGDKFLFNSGAKFLDAVSQNPPIASVLICHL